MHRLTTGLLFLLVLAPAAAADTTVLAVRGRVAVIGEGAALPAVPGARLAAGERLRAGEAAGAELLVGKTLLARLGPGAEVEPGADARRPKLQVLAGRVRISSTGPAVVWVGGLALRTPGGVLLAEGGAAARACLLSGTASTETGGAPLSEGQCLTSGGKRAPLADEPRFPAAGPLASSPEFELGLERPPAADLEHLREDIDDGEAGSESREGGGGSMCLDSGAEGAGDIEQVEGPDIDRDRDVEVTVKVKLERD